MIFFSSVQTRNRQGSWRTPKKESVGTPKKSCGKFSLHPAKMKKNLGAPHEDAKFLGAPPKSEKIIGALVGKKIWAH